MEEQKVPQQYFTEDMEKRMREMGESEMMQLLKNLEQSEFWVAILKYNQVRLAYSQSALFAGDPIKDPSGMTRQQGIMLGLSDLQNAVITLVQNEEADSEVAEGTEVE